MRPPEPSCGPSIFGGGRGSATARDIAVSPSGDSVYVTGSTEEGTQGQSYGTAAYNASGALLWSAGYTGPGVDIDTAYSVGVSPDGATVFVTGEATWTPFPDLNHNYATVAYEAASGDELWVTPYDGAAGGYDRAYSLGVGPDDGTVYVTGHSTGFGDQYDYATVAYDPGTGARLWVGRYNGPAGAADIAYALDVSPDGARVYVTGSSTGPATGEDYATVGYHAATGVRLGVVRYDGPGNGSDVAGAIGVGPGGARLYVTGRSAGMGSGDDYATVAYGRP